MKHFASSAAAAAVTTAIPTGVLAMAPPARRTPAFDVEWIRRVHDDGWVFSLKEWGFRTGPAMGPNVSPYEGGDGWHAVRADPMEVEDYSMRKLGEGASDDTDAFIEACWCRYGSIEDRPADQRAAVPAAARER